MRRFLPLVLLALVGCHLPTPPPLPFPFPKQDPANPPKVRKLANSDYPSWQTFDVADKLGLINREPGKLGTLERKWNVDLVLTRADYVETLNMYGAKAIDAVCMTNTDCPAPTKVRPGVAICPTSTSWGADSCLTTRNDVQSIADLKGKTIHGAEKSVSQFAEWRVIRGAGLKSDDVTFQNMDPSAAGAAMIQKQPGIDIIMVWEATVSQVLAQCPTARVVFDSKRIPLEIIDMIVVAKDVYDSPGGQDFACLLVDTFYQTCQEINKGDKALALLGEEFAHLSPDQMKVVRDRCRFFDTPAAGVKVFEDDTLPKAMPKILAFAKEFDIMTDPNFMVSFKQQTKGTESQLTFDSSIMKKVNQMAAPK